MNCETCKLKQKDATPVPFIVHESDMARLERTIKRMWILIILLVVVLFGSNAAWVYYESQFVDESWTYEATADNGSNAIANGDGEVYFYGSESASDAHETDSEDGR